MFVMLEDNVAEVAMQALVALVCAFGGSAAFAASTFVSILQR